MTTQGQLSVRSPVQPLRTGFRKPRKSALGPYLESRSVAMVCGLAALFLTTVLSGCAARIGPNSIPPARFNYNEALSQSQNEQLLLNLVRLRYRDTPVFMDVGNVIAQYSFNRSASASAGFGINDDQNGANLGINAGGSFTEQPTITYEPLRGSEFTQRLLTPLSPVTLVVLSQSGWSMERLLLCCVERMNDITNAPSASGPTPDFIPDNQEFRELARLLRQLQVQDLLDFDIAAGASGAISLRIRSATDASGAAPAITPDNLAALTRVRQMLNLAPDREEFLLTSRRFRQNPAEIAITGRSLLGVLFFLSHGVEAPQPHLAQGLVTRTAGPDNLPFDWTQITGGLLQIRSGNADPGNAPGTAFTRVRYRDHWFYIQDADLQSKATFNLLSYLFSLQAASESGSSPLLTVPLGN